MENELVSAVMVINKLVVFGIAGAAVWVLQNVATDERWKTAFPILDNYLLRAALTLVATGFAMDFFSVYTPAPSEIIMNLGILSVAFIFYRQFKRRDGDHPLLRWRQKQNS